MWIWLPLAEKYVCMRGVAKISWTHWAAIEYVQGKDKKHVNVLKCGQ